MKGNQMKTSTVLFLVAFQFGYAVVGARAGNSSINQEQSLEVSTHNLEGADATDMISLLEKYGLSPWEDHDNKMVSKWGLTETLCLSAEVGSSPGERRPGSIIYKDECFIFNLTSLGSSNYNTLSQEDSEKLIWLVGKALPNAGEDVHSRITVWNTHIICTQGPNQQPGCLVSTNEG